MRFFQRAGGTGLHSAGPGAWQPKFFCGVKRHARRTGPALCQRDRSRRDFALSGPVSLRHCSGSRAAGRAKAEGASSACAQPQRTGSSPCTERPFRRAVLLPGEAVPELRPYGKEKEDDMRGFPVPFFRRKAEKRRAAGAGTKGALTRRKRPQQGMPYVPGHEQGASALPGKGRCGRSSRELKEDFCPLEAALPAAEGRGRISPPKNSFFPSPGRGRLRLFSFCRSSLRGRK